MVAIQDKPFTIEEYFELEKTAEIRHEFVNGQLIPILNGVIDHRIVRE